MFFKTFTAILVLKILKSILSNTIVPVLVSEHHLLSEFDQR